MSTHNKQFVDGFQDQPHKQMARRQFINRELKENPEFFKAFPHLQEPIWEQTNKGEKQEYLNSY